MERTDEEKLLIQPVQVSLGDQTFALYPLTVDRATLWCKEYAKLIADITAIAGLNEATIAGSAAQIENVLGGQNDKCIDLLLMWAPDLDREYLARKTYPKQIGAAIKICYAMANPM